MKEYLEAAFCILNMGRSTDVLDTSVSDRFMAVSSMSRFPMCQNLKFSAIGDRLKGVRCDC